MKRVNISNIVEAYEITDLFHNFRHLLNWLFSSNQFIFLIKHVLLKEENEWNVGGLNIPRLLLTVNHTYTSQLFKGFQPDTTMPISNIKQFWISFLLHSRQER